jgi:hypothetical protein
METVPGKPPIFVLFIYTLCLIHDICEIPIVTSHDDIFVVAQCSGTEMKVVTE